MASPISGVRTYDAALRYLYSFTDMERVPGMATGAGLDLAKVHTFFDLLGRPERKFHSILVAGTKGKGSTANYLASALRMAGYRVGLYTQPHLTSFRERMQVDGALLPEEALVRMINGIAPVVDRMHATSPEHGPLTTYEIATALALQYFAAEQVDYAVLEIGLGGRLDAVNAVEAPLLSVITSLSLDHTRVLGDTVEQIAFEKAGIIKPGIPVVVAPQPTGAAGVIADVAADRYAPLYWVGEDIIIDRLPTDRPCTPNQHGHARQHTQAVMLRPGERLRGSAGSEVPEQIALTLPLLGAHQATNAAVAAAGCLLLAGQGAHLLTPAAIEAGFAAVVWPGRLEIVRERPLLVLDGAHNGDSALQLAAAMQAGFCYRELVLVLGLLADKDASGILSPLLPLARHVVLTQSGHPRAAGAAQVATQAAAAGHTAAPTLTDTVAAALDAATRLAGPEDAILVTGSLSVVGDARAALGLGAPPDPVTGDFFYRMDKSAAGPAPGGGR
ncbi:MAG TPA: cyanophycin synthetase [Chloroflexia bacterium]|nr:cyanophycin synthetase [Chloroflexia bacterium]